LNTDFKSPTTPTIERSSKTSRPWGYAILSFINGAFAVIVLLVAAYFAIHMFNTSGRMPTRQPKSVVELAPSPLKK